MQIAALTLHGVAGWPTLKLGPFTAGLNAVYGPPRSGKTMLANLVAHTLFGRIPAATPSETPPGEVIVQGDAGRHRVRRYRDEQGTLRLTLAALDGPAIDAGTMRRLVGGLPPAVLGPLCAVSFRQPPDIASLLSLEFAQGYQSIEGTNPAATSRRTAELAARRDLLAHELETRISSERRVSKDLEARCRELDRSVCHEEQQATAVEQRLRATETALAETDARLRYRRLELNVERQRPTTESPDWETPPKEVDEQIARVRAMLAALAQREATVRARLAHAQASHGNGGATFAETQTWLAVGRQLAADLAGEVARLARASASQQCVCRDAHPRLRPISETIERQLDVLDALMDEQQRSFAAAQLQAEVDQLARSQTELQRHLDQLLSRLQSRHCLARMDRRTSSESTAGLPEAAGAGQSSFSAADAEQLETRRLELEQQRFQLVEQVRARGRQLRDLRASRETVERQRAALLSARSIEHVQRELKSVQQKLEQATSACGGSGDMVIVDDSPARASDFLAQLTNGDLVQLVLVEHGRRACVVNRDSQTLRVESLTAAQRDQIYLSLCLALVSAASRHGIRLPLVLDEPFERLDARSTAALAAVLDDFSRQGHQVVVFTGQQAAANRLTSVGATMQDIATSRRSAGTLANVNSPARQHASAGSTGPSKRKLKKRRAEKTTPEIPDPERTSTADRSDAA
ncbi:MAG: hypothetical protein WD738_08375 [Pirellulales bacterium]